MSSLVEPYVGLRPFTEKENSIFCGRKRDAVALLNKIYASRTVVVFAPSGVGKTSLLRAGVQPTLRKDPSVYVVYINDWTKPCLDQVRDALQTALAKASAANAETRPSDNVQNTTLLNLAKDFRVRTGIRPIFILDQFEEVLRYHSNRGVIWDQLAPLMNALNQPARIVLSLREDYLGILDELMNRVPGLMESRFRVQPLSIEAIQDAIREPLTKLNPPFEIDSALVGRIVEDFEARRQDTTTDSRVEAGYLQVVCKRLWDLDKQDPEKRLKLATYESEGGIDRIVESHIQRSIVDSLSPEQQHLLFAMTRYLVTPTGAKVALSVADLSELIGEHDFSMCGRTILTELLGQKPGVLPFKNLSAAKSIEEVAEKLCGASIMILRRKEFRKRISYELCHDVLGSVLLRWRTRVAEEEVKAAQRQTEEAENAKKHAVEEARLAHERTEKVRRDAEKKVRETSENWVGGTVAWVAFLVAICGTFAGFLMWTINASNFTTATLFVPFVAIHTAVVLAFRACLRRKRAIGAAILNTLTPLRNLFPNSKAQSGLGLFIALSVATLLCLCFVVDLFIFIYFWVNDQKVVSIYPSEAFWMWIPNWIASACWLLSIGLAVWRVIRSRRTSLRILAACFVVLSVARIVSGLWSGETTWHDRFEAPLYGYWDAIVIGLLRFGGSLWLVISLIRAVARRADSAVPPRLPSALDINTVATAAVDLPVAHQ